MRPLFELKLSKKEKLLEKLRTLPNNFNFNDLEVILSQFDFIKAKTNAGSHFKWRNEKKNIIYAAPRRNPVKRIYLKQLIEIIDTHFKY